MDDAATLASKLRDDAASLNGYLLSLGVNDRSIQVYTEGGVWTVRNVLAHLMSAERAFVRLFREVQQGGGGVAEGFSVNSFNASEQARYDRMSWEELLEAFQKTRARLVNFVELLSEDDLDRVGRHPFLGITSLREMVKLTYIHARMHVRDIRRALQPG